MRVGSKYLIFSKTEKPVPVKPDIASKKHLKKLVLNWLNKKEVKLIDLLKYIQVLSKLIVQ